MPADAHPSPLPALPRPPDAPDACDTPFAWWCIVRRFDFTCVYGPTAACREAIRFQNPAECLFKGGCATLTDARARAEQAAQGLRARYAGMGTAVAISAEDFFLLPVAPLRRFR